MEAPGHVPSVPSPKSGTGLRDDKKTAFHHLLSWQTSLENVTMCVRIRRKSLLIG